MLYFRKATPPDIMAKRAYLAELGIKVTREVQRSLGTRDRKPAERRYREVSAAVEAEWESWRQILRNGPAPLSHRQILGLAADHSREFLRAHEDEPFEAPPEPAIPPFPSDDATLHAAWLEMAPHEQERLKADVIAYLRAPEPTRRELSAKLLTHYPAFAASFGVGLATALDSMHGADTEKALKRQRLTVGRSNRNLVNLAMVGSMGAAHRGLEARRAGDYGPVKELLVAPTFGSPATGNSPDAGLTLGFLLDHKARTFGMREKTVRDTRAHLQKFIEFVGHDDARRVTRDEVRRWRDLLIESAVLSPKTITDRYLSAVKSVLEHGVREFDLPSNAASNMRDNRAGPVPKGSKGYSEQEAVNILLATATGSKKALSAPHKRAIRWVPWVLAYTGLRVTEVTQLRARNLREEGGVLYLFITPEDGSTKGGRAWLVPIHEHLVELGLIDFIRQFGDGPIFYEPYPDGVNPADIKGKHRAQEAGVRVGKWITNELGISAPLNRPNHAWRHLFTTRSRRFGMDKMARDFMMGSGSIDAREGYGDWPPDVLGREINKLGRFQV